MSKQIVREKLIEDRNKIVPSSKALKDDRIRERLFVLPEFQASGTILCYASFRSEVETFGIMREALRAHKRVILPKVYTARHELKLYKIESMKELESGYKGIMEPAENTERQVLLSDVPLVIVPGVAFDTHGNRLGYGGGYYDAMLAKRTKGTILVALAYEEQMVLSLPAEPHDVRVDIVITDKRVIRSGV